MAQISFTLSESKFVSLAVYEIDVTGRETLKATLCEAKQYTVPPGQSQTFTETWEPPAGQPLSNYRWRRAEWPVAEGLRAEFMSSIGSTLPEGTEWWQTGLSNHVGPRSVAADSEGNIYLGGGNSENVRNALKMNKTGTTCIWSADNPVPSEHTRPLCPGGRHELGEYLGRYALDLLEVDGELRLYHLQQDGWVGWHAASKGNGEGKYVFIRPGLKEEVEREDGRVIDFGTPIGGGWSAEPNDAAGASPDDWRGYTDARTCDGKTIPDQPEVVPEMPMDMATGKVDMATGSVGGEPVVVVSHRNSNIVVLHAPDGQPITATPLSVPRPTGVALGGRSLFVATQGEVRRYPLNVSALRGAVSRIPLLGPAILSQLSRVGRRLAGAGAYSVRVASRFQSLLIPFTIGENYDSLAKGLQSPYRLAYDSSDDSLLIVGRDGTIRRVNAAGQSVWTIGNPYRRSVNGPYKRTEFRDVVDICVHNYTEDNGTMNRGFLIVEGSAPRRVARFKWDGTWDKEWYGGTFWIPTASADPVAASFDLGNGTDQNAIELWVTATPHELMCINLHRDLNGNELKQWSVSSVHRVTDFRWPDADPLTDYDLRVPIRRGRPLKRTHSFGGGELDWHLRRHPAPEGTRRFLVRRGRVEVLGVYPSNNRHDAILFPSAAAGLIRQKDSNEGFKTPFSVFPGRDREGDLVLHWNDWSDPNRDIGVTNNSVQGLASIEGFDYFHLALSDDGKIPVVKGEILRLTPAQQHELGPSYVPYPPLWQSFSKVLPDQSFPKQSEPSTEPPIFAARFWQRSQSLFAQDSKGALFMLVNLDQRPVDPLVPAGNKYDDEAEVSCLLKFHPDGGIAWMVGRAQERGYRRNPVNGMRGALNPGEVYTMRSIVGVARGAGVGREVVFATDFDGGYNGKVPALVYAWTEDGLVLNNPFDFPGNNWHYTHSSDNASGTFLNHPYHGVLYFAGGENEVRVYKITGWNSLIHESGPFQP